MGRVLQADNVPTLVVASTTSVQIPATFLGQPTRLTIGGQQFALTSALTMTAGTPGANSLDAGTLGAIQLWYVYAIVNQSTRAVALVASQTGPGTGPTMPIGYGTAYKLVGAFYTNGSSQVGSPVPIVGAAVSEKMAYTPTLAGGAAATIQMFWRRVMDCVELSGNIKFTGAGAAAAVGITMPGSLVPIASKLQSLNAVTANVGTASYYNTSVTEWIDMYLVDITGSIHFVSPGTPATDLQGSGLAANYQIGINAMIPVSGWTSTLL